ncbi:unnamed protein product [Brachionus calyciflorus]|uniref:Uncharacterized protein n=1 Tax=Brachionus calyciflorus TaxID=104777 RepID=A0A814PL16_9BILA|nr:unnamed protein product [Brachionus calyciflorus]
MLPFADWTSNDVDETNAIVKRSEEIKNLIEVTRESAISNIKKNQNKQVINQNRASNVTTEIIPIGSTVFIKSEGLLTKLEPRFKGPYKIVGFTKRGNYLVTNALGEKLVDSFPIQKLEVVEENDTLTPFSF